MVTTNVNSTTAFAQLSTSDTGELLFQNLGTEDVHIAVTATAVAPATSVTGHRVQPGEQFTRSSTATGFLYQRTLHGVSTGAVTQ